MSLSADLDIQTASLQRGERMTAARVCSLVEGVLAGEIDLAAFGRWLVALADAGETAAEIAGVAAALRSRMLPLEAGLSSGTIVADTCGTGGDGSGSFNISTAAAIVVAAAGQPVAKHGNRAVSSRTGSADALAELGVKADAAVEVAASCLRELGICFCLAPIHHPAMARVGPLRKSLCRPTVFNLVGPLCNPAGASVQVIGVGRPGVREPIAEAARLLGATRTLVVSGYLTDPTAADVAVPASGHPTDAAAAHLAEATQSPTATPFDELSLFGPSDVIDVSPKGVNRYRWTPADFGLATLSPTHLADLEVAGPAESAAAIRGVLAGEPGPRRDVVVLNAAAVLWAAGRAADPVSAREAAEVAIDSQAASQLLERLARLSHES